MIVNAWSSGFTAKYGHQFPSSYLCFDTEFTGRNERDDLIVEIGHVLVEDGKVVDKLSLILNWYDRAEVQPGWLDYRLNQLRYLVGDNWRLLPAVVKKEGIPPLQALKFYYELFRTWADRGLPFVSQNGAIADEPMLRAHLNRYLDKTIEIPANSYWDTGALFKANQVWQAETGNLANYRAVVMPSRSDTLKSYFRRICGMRVPGLHWSLKTILEHFDLVKKHQLDVRQLHGAGFDALCLHLIMEEYRSRIVPRGETAEPPAQQFQAELAKFEQQQRQAQKHAVPVSTSRPIVRQSTPVVRRRQRLV